MFEDHVDIKVIFSDREGAGAGFHFHSDHTTSIHLFNLSVVVKVSMNIILVKLGWKSFVVSVHSFQNTKLKIANNG